MAYRADNKRWPAMLAAAAGGILGATALIWARSPGTEPAAQEDRGEAGLQQTASILEESEQILYKVVLGIIGWFGQ